MAESKKTSRLVVIIGAISAGVTAGGGGLVAFLKTNAAQAQSGQEAKVETSAPATPPGGTTASQVTSLSLEVRGYRDELRGYRDEVQGVLKRLREVEIEQAEQRGATKAANFRERPR